MNYKLIVGALLALAVLATGAAAAAPGNAPVDVPTDNQTDAADNATDAADAGQAAADERQGPPADLPDQVPDFVGEIHDLIEQHISGSLDGILGHQVSDVTPDNETASGQGADEMPAQAADA